MSKPKPTPVLIKKAAPPPEQPDAAKVAGSSSPTPPPSPPPTSPPPKPPKLPKMPHAGPGKRRRRDAHRFTKAQRHEVVVAVAKLLRTGLEPLDVRKYVETAYHISDKAAHRLVGDAVNYLVARYSPKGTLRALLCGYFTQFMTDPSVSVSERIAAAKEVGRLVGAYAPDRVLNGNIDANAADPVVAAEALQQMHADLMGDPEALDMATRLYERLGAAEAAGGDGASTPAPAKIPSVPDGPLPCGIKELPPKPKPPKVGFVAPSNGNGAH
jgi:hypothetical protein